MARGVEQRSFAIAHTNAPRPLHTHALSLSLAFISPKPTVCPVPAMTLELASAHRLANSPAESTANSAAEVLCRNAFCCACVILALVLRWCVGSELPSVCGPGGE